VGITRYSYSKDMMLTSQLRTDLNTGGHPGFSPLSPHLEVLRGWGPCRSFRSVTWWPGGQVWPQGHLKRGRDAGRWLALRLMSSLSTQTCLPSLISVKEFTWRIGTSHLRGVQKCYLWNKWIGWQWQPNCALVSGVGDTAKCTSCWSDFNQHRISSPPPPRF
jgi:hypothetical protein